MGCCCFCNKKEEQTEEEKLYGPRAHRSCRDIPCLLLFILFWAGMIVVAVLAFWKGDLDRLWYGTDMYGDMCGINNGAGVDYTDVRNTLIGFDKVFRNLCYTGLTHLTWICNFVFPNALLLLPHSGILQTFLTL